MSEIISLKELQACMQRAKIDTPVLACRVAGRRLELVLLGGRVVRLPRKAKGARRKSGGKRKRTEKRGEK